MQVRPTCAGRTVVGMAIATSAMVDVAQIIGNKTMDALSEAQRNWIDGAPIIPATLTVRALDGQSTHTYEVLDRDAEGRVHGLHKRRGWKGFVLRVRDPATHEEFAAKLAVPGDYKQPRLEQELLYTSKLRPAKSLFVCPMSVGLSAPPPGMPDAEEDFVCFIAPWVTGRTLEQYLQEDSLEIDFVCSVAMQVLRAITYLKRVELKHDDLHVDNVMISQVPAELALLADDEHRLEVSIIDLGSLKPSNQTTSKSRDDKICFVQILVELYNGLHRNRRVASSHPHFMRRFLQFIEKLVDEDQARHFPIENQIAQELQVLQRELEEVEIDESKFQPFEAISAEHLADDATLLELFVETLPWMQDIQERKPIVLTGPRGCGKSMIFRYLAVRTHLGLRAQNAERGRASPFDSFGVYISCAAHLQNNLSWLARKEGRAEQRAHEIATYFQLIVARELLKSLGMAYADSVANRAFRLDEAGFDNIVALISSYFSRPVESARLTNRSRILHFADDLDALRVQLHGTLLRDGEWNDHLPDTFLADLTGKLGSVFPYFKRHQVVFLLDDYSSNRVQEEIQRILNKIIFERVPTHYFKISCEKFGFDPGDIDGVTLEETREFTTIDAGSRALADVDDHAAKRFVTNLIDRRLSRAGWAGRAEKLIGSSEPYADDVQLASYIREHGSTQGRRYYYHGLHALGRLWSGDTATVLQIVREMFVKGSVQRDTTAPITKAAQHEAIVSISKAFKERVDGLHPFGALMAKILGQYGAAVRDVMVKGRLNSAKEPYRLYRLEMTKDEPRSTIALLRDLDPELGSLARELLRRAIFIELQDSRAKEGLSKQTMRWELRRIFNPAFGLSLKRDSYLGVRDIEELQTFLTAPERFADRARMSYATKSGADRFSGELFEDTDD